MLRPSLQTPKLILNYKNSLIPVENSKDKLKKGNNKHGINQRDCVLNKLAKRMYTRADSESTMLDFLFTC